MNSHEAPGSVMSLNAARFVISLVGPVRLRGHGSRQLFAMFFVTKEVKDYGLGLPIQASV